jgi:two-component system phosphate regulon response regulator PhoB
MNNTNILVVEDEESIREMLVMVLERAEFSVRAVPDTTEGQKSLDDGAPDLILLDWTLPGLSGVEWARRLKKDKYFSDIPIIMLTARGEEEDKIRGFDVGADDYVTKPFSTRELVARINAVLRGSGRLGSSGKVEIGGIELSIDEHRVVIGGRSVVLSPMEYRLLEFFLTHPDKVYSRNQLLDMVWGRNSFIEERTVDVHIRRLRKALEDFGREEMIQTVRGFGYRFSEKF